MSDTLEAALRARLADPRAMIAALSISADRMLLNFGEVAENPRIVLQIVGNEVQIMHPSFSEPTEKPEDEQNAPAATVDAEDAEKLAGEPGSGQSEPSEAEPSGEVDPDDYTKAQLVELADKAGIDIPTGATKAQIAELLNAAK